MTLISLFKPRRILRQALLALALAAVSVAGLARAETAERTGPVTGLPIPRFVAVGSNEVNVRTGPGNQYPIAWVFVRRGLPVEVVAEFEHYRKIRDQDGAEGWVHKNLLSGRRTAVVTGAVRGLHRDPDPGAPTVLLAEPGVQGRLLKCRDVWCEMEISGRRGYLPRSHIWGVYPDENFD